MRSLSFLCLLGSRTSSAFIATRPTHLVTSPTTQLASSYLEGLDGAVPYSSSTGTPSSTSSDNTDFAYVPVLKLQQADTIANNVISCCQRNGFAPITVVVLDAAGSTLVSKRMDGCSPVGLPEFAHAKAYSCVVNRYPSRMFRDRYTSENESAKFGQMLSMVAVSGGKMAPFPGGIVLKLGENVVGAVGVSGAAGDEDEYCAIRGVMEAELGLSTLPEQHSCSTVKDT